MTDEELQALADQLGPLVSAAAKAEGLNTPQDIMDWLERLLTTSGYRCINGIWQSPTH
jgi:hypothetical protein